MLRIDTEDDPAGAFDLIFERLRDAPDGTGDVAHSHATFRALIAGVEPTTPPPWSDAYRFAEAAASAFDLDSIRNRAYGWGWTVGQVAASAGRVESVALPQLVHRLAQVSEAAARAVPRRRAPRVPSRDAPGPRHGRMRDVPRGDVHGRGLRGDLRRVSPGTRRGPGASVCEACAPGTFAAVEGASACCGVSAGDVPRVRGGLERGAVRAVRARDVRRRERHYAVR